MNKSILLIILITVFFSCKHDRLDVDISDIKMPELTINRLEQDIFNLDTLNIKASAGKLENKYGSFYKAYYTGILNSGGIHDTDYAAKLKRFISDKDMRNAYNDCQKAYPNVDYLKEEFTKAFKYYKHYFPNKNIPNVVTMMSGFNYPVAPLDSTIGIGLEMYLGSNSIYYKMLAFPRYKSMFMNKENILPDAMRQYALIQFPYNMNKSDFLSQIIYMGKIMYLTDAVLPDVQDTLKTLYTKKQMQYCTQNEFNIWSYFIAQKKLYTTDQAEIMKFTADGPFTSSLSKDAPPRIGYWVGFQIVKQYMNKNSDITIQQLMNETDAQKILTKAKYKPAK